MAESYFRSFKTPVVTLRPFNTYGPGQSLRAVTPTIIAQALRGNEIRLGSLTPVRDLLFVKDTARAFILAGVGSELEGEVVQVGTGSAISIGELVTQVQKILGTSKLVKTDEDRVRPEKSEVMTLICKNDKAKRILGWEPRFTLDEGLRETIEWLDKNWAQMEVQRYAV